VSRPLSEQGLILCPGLTCNVFFPPQTFSRVDPCDAPFSYGRNPSNPIHWCYNPIQGPSMQAISPLQYEHPSLLSRSTTPETALLRTRVDICNRRVFLGAMFVRSPPSPCWMPQGVLSIDLPFARGDRVSSRVPLLKLLTKYLSLFSKDLPGPDIALSLASFPALRHVDRVVVNMFFSPGTPAVF